MSASAPPPRPAVHVSLALLVLIAFSGTLGMHIFVPALPSAAQALHTDSKTIQLSITLYILGLALGQLIYGPISDAIGRRPTILCGLGIYLLGGLMASLAPNINLLLVARLIQALGGAGGLALTRVVVADTSGSGGVARKIAILNLLLLLGPGLAPVLGAQILGHLGWQMIFVMLTLMGGLALLLSWRYLPETGTPSHDFNARVVAGKFATLLRNRIFLRCLVGGAFGSTTCYAYFVSAPFILHSEMGLSVEAVSFWVGSTLAATAVGTLLTRSLIGRVADRMLMRVFASLELIAATLFLLLALSGQQGPASVIVLSLLLLFAAGGLGPLSIGTAFRLAGPNVGSAAGLWGAAQMFCGMICSLGVGLFTNHSLGCGLVLFCGTLISAVQLLRLPRG